MKLCPTCQRHLRSPEARCPFCGAEQRSGAAGLAASVLLGAMLAACSDKPLDTAGSSESSGASMGGSTTSGASSSTGPTTAAPTSSSSTEPDGTSTLTPTTNGSSNDTVDDAGDEGCAFYAGCPADVGPSPFECSTFEQDCPDDQKCAPWASNGTSTPNATKCVPIDGDKQIGEACQAMDGGTSGQDDCVKGALCWEIDGQGAGHCVALCGGTPQEPSCGADEACVAFGEAVSLCALTCDPLMQGCPDDDVCVSDGDDFVCVVDASGDTGAVNDDCSFVNSCDPGLTCLASADVSASCESAVRCCTPFCEFPGGTCPNPDQVCVQWDGEETVGFCGLMP